jgi:hypothetical protein
MTMGQTGMGMGRMAEMMRMPPNSITMKGAPGTAVRVEVRQAAQRRSRAHRVFAGETR